jgi:tetratricopeptide (TPR) repeat protein
MGKGARGMNRRACAILLTAATLLAGAARAQSTHDEYMTWCTGGDLERKMLGCSALINSGQETPETLAIAYLNRGNALVDNGQIDVAIQEYGESLKNNPLSAEAFGRRGIALELKAEFDSAVGDCDNALKLDPKNAKAFVCRGYSRSHKKEFDGAIDDYSQAIKLNPDYAWTFRLRASAYREKAQYDLAIQDCDQAIKLDPDNAAVAYYVRGLSKQKKGDKSGAKADIATAKQLDPKVDQK